MLVSFYTSRIVLNSLGVMDYGVYNVVGGIVGTLAYLTTAMATTIQRWLTIAIEKGDKESIQQTFSVTLTTQVIIAIILIIMMETTGLWYLNEYAVIPADRLNAAVIVFHISTITAALTVLNAPFQGLILSHEQMGIFAFFSIIDVLIKLSICFLLPIAQTDKLILYAILLFAAFGINLLCVWIYCLHHFHIHIKLQVDKSIMRNMWNVAFWNMTGKLVFVSYSQGLVLLINAFFGPAMNTAANISSQATNLLNQLGQNFQVAVNPQITKNYATGNYFEMQKLVFRSIKFSYFLMLFIAVPFFYEANLLLHFWLGNVPEHTLLFTRLAVFVTLTTSLSHPLNTAAIACGNVRKYQLYTNSVLFFILPATFLAYTENWMPETSCIIFAFFLFLSTFVAAWVLSSLVNLSFNSYITKVIFPISIVTLLVFLIPLPIYLYLSTTWWRIIPVIMTSSIGTGLVIYFYGLNKDERRFTAMIIKEKRILFGKKH